MEYKYDVFISYSRKDYLDQNKNIIPGNVISVIKERFDQENITYWFDEDGIVPSDAFASVIGKNIKLSRMLLFISSENSNVSEWTNDEIAAARQLKRKIIPFRIDNSEYSESLIIYLAKLDFIDYPSNHSLALDRLVKSIRKHKDDLSEKEEGACDAVKKEVLVIANNIKSAMRIQRSNITKIHRKLLSIGISEKTCPICASTSKLDQKFCECCGFYFPDFYGLTETEKDVDPTYLAIMQGMWALVSNGNKEEFEVNKNSSEELAVRKNKKEKGVIVVNGVKFKMIPVEGGVFMMGDGENASKVSLSSYKIGETPVTQALWKAVMGNNPSKFVDDEKPVEQVSWEDCQKFINKLNGMTGKEFRLPSEAEWEFAARGGNRSLNSVYSGDNSIDNVAWYDLNCSENENSELNYGTHEVKAKSPNELRIYDMSGNVWEWCDEWYDNYKTYRVCRGGSWNSRAESCAVSFRNFGGPLRRDCSCGLRLAL